MNEHALHLNVFWVEVIIYPQTCGLFTWYIFLLLEVFISLALISSFKQSTSPMIVFVWFVFPFFARDTHLPLNVFKTCLLALRTARTQIHVKNSWLGSQQSFFASKTCCSFVVTGKIPGLHTFGLHALWYYVCLFSALKNQLSCSSFFGNSVVLSIGNQTDLDTCQMQFSSLLFYSVAASPLDSLYYGALMIMF